MLSSMLCMLFKYVISMSCMLCHICKYSETTRYIKSVDTSLVYNFDC